MHKLLANHEVRVEDFVDEPCVDFVQPSITTPAVMSKPPGHTILVHLTSDSAMLNVVSYLFIVSDSVLIFTIETRVHGSPVTVLHSCKARFPLPELTARVDG